MNHGFMRIFTFPIHFFVKYETFTHPSFFNDAVLPFRYYITFNVVPVVNLQLRDSTRTNKNIHDARDLNLEQRGHKFIYTSMPRSHQNYVKRATLFEIQPFPCLEFSMSNYQIGNPSSRQKIHKMRSKIPQDPQYEKQGSSKLLIPQEASSRLHEGFL